MKVPLQVIADLERELGDVPFGTVILQIGVKDRRVNNYKITREKSFAIGPAEAGREAAGRKRSC